MPLDEALIATLPADMNVDVDGKAIHIKDTPFLKEAKDFPSFVKGAYDAHREVGARIPVKVDVTKPETVEAWRKEHLPKLYKAGVLAAPPESPAAYEIKKPDGDLPGLVWDDARATAFAELAHKHGLSKDAAHALIAFQAEALSGANDVVMKSYEDGLKALKDEYKDQFDVRSEQASRLAASIFKTDAELKWFEDAGLANHPTFLSILMRLAPLAESDSSVLAGLPSSNAGGLTGEAVKQELADIMSNPENPKNKLYWSGDKATLEYIDGLYKKVYGDAKVNLSAGLTAGGGR